MGVNNKRFKPGTRGRDESFEKAPSNINQISLMKLLSSKDDARRTQNNKYFINISDLTGKSRSNSRSYSKGRRVEVASLHKDDLEDFDKNRIHIDKRSDTNSRPHEKPDTVVTVKKKRE